MDFLAVMVGGLLGYGMPAIIFYSIAFVVAKSIKKKWPYIVATLLTTLFYVALLIGLNFLKTTGQY